MAADSAARARVRGRDGREARSRFSRAHCSGPAAGEAWAGRRSRGWMASRNPRRICLPDRRTIPTTPLWCALRGLPLMCGVADRPGLAQDTGLDRPTVGESSGGDAEPCTTACSARDADDARGTCGLTVISRSTTLAWCSLLSPHRKGGGSRRANLNQRVRFHRTTSTSRTPREHRPQAWTRSCWTLLS